MSEIRTVEELSALPEGSVLRSARRMPVFEVRRPPHAWQPGERDRLILRGGTEWHPISGSVFEFLGPLTLLHRPDWPSQADLRAAVDAALALPRWDHLDAYEEVTGQCVDVDDLLRALAPVADPDPHTTSDKET